jgi:hypothetical protein
MYRWKGPELALIPEPAQALAIVLHELVTNAVKYGIARCQCHDPGGTIGEAVGSASMSSRSDVSRGGHR